MGETKGEKIVKWQDAAPYKLMVENCFGGRSAPCTRQNEEAGTVRGREHLLKANIHRNQTTAHPTKTCFKGKTKKKKKVVGRGNQGGGTWKELTEGKGSAFFLLLLGPRHNPVLSAEKPSDFSFIKRSISLGKAKTKIGKSVAKRGEKIESLLSRNRNGEGRRFTLPGLDKSTRAMWEEGKDHEFRQGEETLTLNQNDTTRGCLPGVWGRRLVRVPAV